MVLKRKILALTAVMALATGVSLSARVFMQSRATVEASSRSAARQDDTQSATNAEVEQMTKQGREIFRFDTFGDEAYWGDTLHLHQAIEGSKLGGVGPGVSPKTALAVGLKVDVDALPASLVNALKQGKVNLDDPATTLALLKLNAVLGVTGFFNEQGTLRSVGLQCAFCHSTVDDSLGPSIGHRLDGWANRDLNVGAIVALAPDLDPAADLLGVDQATVRKVLNSWGPGHFDAELFLDGKAFRPDGNRSGTDSAGFWTCRCEPSHLDRMGFCNLLECLRGRSRNARQRQFFRSATK